MRIVAVADTHGRHHDLDPLPAGDVLVHAGDLTLGGSLMQLEAVAEWLRAQPHRHKLVIAGNHDWCFFRDRRRAEAVLGDGIAYLQDQAITIDGVRVWGSPWQPEFFGWAFNLPRGPALAERWAAIPDAVDVLVTHGPPRGFGDRVARDERVGCDDLWAAVQRARPTLHLYGHIHEDGGLGHEGGSCLVNATTWEGERGATVLDLDAAGRRVEAIVVPPRRG
jgi:Icc-related predicted phosphoesterase